MTEEELGLCAHQMRTHTALGRLSEAEVLAALQALEAAGWTIVQADVPWSPGGGKPPWAGKPPEASNAE